MIIDVFCHHVPKSIKGLIAKSGFYEAGTREGKIYQSYPANNGDPEVRLRDMDKYKVDVQVLSQTTPVLLGANPEEASEICRLSNDANHALCKAYPERFINISILSLLDVKSALNELNRSINELDCRGIVVASNQNGKGLDSTEYYPVYEKMVQHDLPLFIHPTNWDCYPLVGMETGLGSANTIGWPFDTTQAVWRIIMGGVIDRIPDLKVVTHHCGAMIPFFAKRIEGSFKRTLKRSPEEYWDNIYGDTALSGSVAGCECGYAFFGAERMMFGSDYPFGGGEISIQKNLEAVMAMRIPEEDRKKILGESAKKLLKIK